MTVQLVNATDDELLDVAQQLAREYAALPAGLVLSCLARAAEDARGWGCPPEHLATTAAASARWHLSHESAG